MKDKSHPKVAFKWSRVDEGLLLSAFSAPWASHVYRIAITFYDTAKENIFFYTTKLFFDFFVLPLGFVTFGLHTYTAKILCLKPKV